MFILHWAMIVLSLYITSSTSLYASYTKAQCPAGITDVMDNCRCRQSSGGSYLYVHCELEGTRYRRLPIMGQVNATVRRLTLTNATVEEVPRSVFANVLVSINTFIAISPIISTNVQLVYYHLQLNASSQMIFDYLDFFKIISYYHCSAFDWIFHIWVLCNSPVIFS